MSVNDSLKRAAIAAHRRLGGKVQIANKAHLDTTAKLNLYYTPGVGAISAAIAKRPQLARQYTGISNSVAIVSDGSSVLGLGNIGPLPALPVMEGKAMLFKRFAGINAFPIVLNTRDPKKIVSAVRAIAPSFGAINLEDIAAPSCFYIEDQLKKTLPIPVMHDDQHGTAVVVLAGLINASKVVKKDIEQMQIVIVGAGAAGNAIARLLIHHAKPDVIVVDSKGILSPKRQDLDIYKTRLLQITNRSRLSGSLEIALKNADAVIGVSKANNLKARHIKLMADRPIVFAMANPDPEIHPNVAKAAGAAVVATGRSDFPNQINNALSFPGIFRGALDHQVRRITKAQKLAAAYAIAGLVKNPTSKRIIPSIFDKQLVPAIAHVIK